MDLSLQKQIKDLALSVLPADSKIGVFGSRIKGAPSKFSDVDLVVLGKTRLQGHVLELIREKMENSSLPYRVDVVDLNSVSNDFRKNALNEIVWL